MTPDELAQLCAASMPEEHLVASELARICYGDGDTVFGTDEAAAAYTVKRFGEFVSVWLLLVAVHPEAQGRGLGKQLVGDVIDRARAFGATHVHLANAIPRYVWPGVDLMNTRAGMLFETMGFERNFVGVNMAIDTSFRREPPPGVHVERETGDGAIGFAQAHYPHWVEELTEGIRIGGAFAARDDDGATIGFACHSVNRKAWIGPMATEPVRQHGGVGSALLAALCADLHDRGIATGEISWVSNLRFYGKCGATVSRVFQGGHLAL